MPVILPSKLLRRASDEGLAAHYERVQDDSRKGGRARAQVLHEMERRDALAEGKKARKRAKFSRQLKQAEAVEASYVHAGGDTREHGERHGPGLADQPADAHHRPLDAY